MNRHRLWYIIRSAIPDAYYEVRWAFQRVFRGHDERVMWGLNSYLNDIIPDIKKFCHDELADTATRELNQARFVIFTETLRLIAECENAVYHEVPSPESLLWEYIGKNVGYFWD